MECPASLGKVIMIGLDKEAYLFLPDDDWFCVMVKVETPENETLHFPCYSWVMERQLLLVREGKGKFSIILRCLKMCWVHEMPPPLQLLTER